MLFFCLLTTAIFQIIQSIRMGMWNEWSSVFFFSSPGLPEDHLIIPFSYLIFICLKFFHHNTTASCALLKSWRNVIFWNIPMWDYQYCCWIHNWGNKPKTTNDFQLFLWKKTHTCLFKRNAAMYFLCSKFLDQFMLINIIGTMHLYWIFLYI